ncbi:MAG TPA: ankyrin repeat domain-containing protein [Tepidisphaeraceae bacterium]|nr:ankyrin repeat domain-containing protein [Tepidisphaeraceae bacterium]
MLAGTEEHRALLRPKFPAAFELFYAVLEGTADEVRGRLAAGDDPQSRSADGRTPIAFALRGARDLGKADSLFAAGALLNVTDHLGMQPIHWTTGSTFADVNCLTGLLDRGADSSAPVQPAIDFQFHPIGWTPLHVAADCASLAATGLLIDRHADARRASADGSTALHVAVGKFRVYKWLIRMLLDGGANIDAADCLGRTALHVLAAGNGRYRKTAIQLLRHRNAHLEARDARGRRPIDLVPDGLPATPTIRHLLQIP